MLFALAAGEVAIETAELVARADQLDQGFIAYLPGYLHLVLAGCAIAFSWVGWGKSKFGPHARDIDSIFSLDFLELALDVVLVVFYFILAHSVEKPVGLAAPGVFEPSCSDECWWVTLILTLYVVWDVVAKWDRLSGSIGLLWAGMKSGGVAWVWRLLSHPVPETDPLHAWNRLPASVFCAGIAWCAYLFVLPIGASDAVGVCLTDVALLLNLLLFRALKDTRYKWAAACLAVTLLTGFAARMSV
jgi:hypothetical protein